MTKRLILGLIGSFLLCSTLPAQVSLMPFPSQQFFDENGNPCAGCLVYTYQSGTSTPLATYTDYTGGTQNTNPVILNSSGYPESGGGTLVGVWLTAGSAYRITLTLANGTQVYQIDGVYGAAPSSVANGGNQAVTTVTYTSSPVFTAVGQNQVFKMTLTGNVSSSSIILSALTPPAIISFELTQDATGGRLMVFPPIAIGAGVIDQAPNTTSFQQFVWDGTFLYATSPTTYTPSQYLSGNYLGTLTTSDISSLNVPATGGVVKLGVFDTICWRGASTLAFDDCLQEGGPEQNIIVPLYLLNSSTGTVAGNLAKIVNGGLGQVLSTSDTGGAVGIAFQGGTSGVAAVQQYGLAYCNFDGSTTQNDYAQISNTTTSTSPVAGDCHDSGAALPTAGGQIVGRVITTIGSAGSATILLFGPEIQPSSYRVVAPSIQVGVNPTGTTPTPVGYEGFPSGYLVAGKVFRVTFGVGVTPAASYTDIVYLGLGSTISLTTTTPLVSVTTASASGWSASVVETCVVITGGTSGSLMCTPVINMSNVGLTYTISSAPVVISSQNLSGNYFVGPECSFGTANASNLCLASSFVLETLN
jgi:hypothetical protein